MLSHYSVTKPRMSSTKRQRTTESGAETAAKASGSSKYATRDANPEIMPIPKRIANQVADYYTCTLKYVWYGYARSTVNNTPWVQQFRINSIYDPDYSGVGGQPMGRDLLASIYAYYRVLQTDIKTTLVQRTPSPGAASTEGVLCGLTVGDLVGTQQGSFPGNTYEFGGCKRGRVWLVKAVEKPFICQRTIFPGALDETIDTNGSSDQTLLSIWTPVGANPAEEQYYTLSVNGPHPSHTSYFDAIVEMKFTVQWRQPAIDSTMD